MKDIIMYNTIFTLGTALYFILLAIAFSKEKNSKVLSSNILMILCALTPLLIIDTYQAGIAGDLLTGGFAEVAIFGIFNIPVLIVCFCATVIALLKYAARVIAGTDRD